MGAADAAGALRRIFLRPMPSRALNWHPSNSTPAALCWLAMAACTVTPSNSPTAARCKPTDDPPSLEHIADKTTREWIYAWLKDPQAYAVSATMPNFKLSDDDARDISAFLIANSTPILGDTAPITPAGKDQKAADPTAGASLYGESFCASCHAVQNAAGNVVGGDVGPELTRIGNKAKPEWLRAWLRNPRVYDPGTAMPHYRFTDQQVSLLATFLGNKADADLLTNVHLDAATPEQIAHGKLLATEYGCASCHEITGIKKPDNFAPELTRIGSKPLAQILFLPDMQRTLPDYISAKIRQPRAFGAALKMPQYALAPGADRCFDHCAAFVYGSRATNCRRH